MKTMFFDRSEYEILAPAGSRETFAAALAAGADAVYLGVGRLNMRSHAARAFCAEDLPELVERAHAAGARLYLTVNTILYDEDLEEMRSLLATAREARVDAVIVSDPAAMTAAFEIGIPVHLSTQLNISNFESLRFFARFADVAVLARELSIEQIARICGRIEAENLCGPSGKRLRIETFAHGALCMAVSGKCYLSLHTRGKSANRGECLQNCRRTYTVTDTVRGTELEIDNGYVMSPKDLKTIGFLPEMLHAGVRILKIEGRARSPEYVLETVSCYREALEAVLEGAWSEEKLAGWDERLARVFNRGFWSGHYLGRTAGEWTSGYGSKATEKKVALGRIVNYFAKSGVAHALVEAGSVKAGEKLLVTGPTTGAVMTTPESLFVREAPASEAHKGEDFTFRCPERVRAGDALYKLVPAEG